MSRVLLKAIISYLEIAHWLIFKWEMSRTSLMAIVFLFGSRPKSKFKKEMSSFSRMALISHTFSFVIHRGAMRQKMAILKWGNSVCRDTKFFRYLILSTQRISEPPDKGGRCNRKCRFSRKETAFAGVQNFTEISFYLHKDYNINNL